MANDITEHRTVEGKHYVCAVKDVWPNRIVGYSISDRMESAIAVNALEPAVAFEEHLQSLQEAGGATIG